MNPYLGLLAVELSAEDIGPLRVTGGGGLQMLQKHQLAVFSKSEGWPSQPDLASSRPSRRASHPNWRTLFEMLNPSTLVSSRPMLDATSEEGSDPLASASITVRSR